MGKLRIIAFAFLLTLLVGVQTAASNDACEQCLMDAEVTANIWYEQCKSSSALPDDPYYCVSVAQAAYAAGVRSCYNSGVCRAD